MVLVSENGLSEGVMNELDRALEDHELIKIRVNTMDREDKVAIINEICAQCGAELAQVIGKMAVLYRPAKKQNPKLSNLVRLQQQ